MQSFIMKSKESRNPKQVCEATHSLDKNSKILADSRVEWLCLSMTNNYQTHSQLSGVSALISHTYLAINP